MATFSPKPLLLHSALESGFSPLPSFLTSGLGEQGEKFLLRKVPRIIFSDHVSRIRLSPAHVSPFLYFYFHPHILSLPPSTQFSSSFLPRVKTKAGREEGSGGKTVCVRSCLVSLLIVAGGTLSSSRELLQGCGD